jgi:hypothetical protein
MTQHRKPKVKLTGQDGNPFHLMGLCVRALRQAGQAQRANEMTHRIMTEARSYEEALVMMQEYCDVR